MLKIMLRIVILLLAAGIISGGLYLWVNHAGISLAGGQRSGIEGGFAPSGQIGSSQPGGLDKGSGGDGDFGGGLQVQRGMTDMASKLGIILLITAAVALVQKAAGLVTRKRTLSRT